MWRWIIWSQLKGNFSCQSLKVHYKQLQDLKSNSYANLFWYSSIFKKRGFSIDGLIGMDISSNMLQKAKERKCYSSLIWEDVLKPLQFHENSFDYIICVGTTTYLGM